MCSLRACCCNGILVQNQPSFIGPEQFYFSHQGFLRRTACISELPLEGLLYAMMDALKKAWGVGAPKGFKAGAWVVAIAAFGAWQYFDNKRALPPAVDLKSPTSPKQ